MNYSMTFESDFMPIYQPNLLKLLIKSKLAAGAYSGERERGHPPPHKILAHRKRLHRKEKEG